MSVETSDQQGDPIHNEYPETTSGAEPGSKKEEESDDEVIQQPIPFQMGVTPMAEEREITEGRTYQKSMSPEQMKMEWDLHEPDIIQVHLDRQ